MSLPNLNYKLANMLLFLLGLGINISTSLMSFSYITIALVACCHSDFLLQLKSVFKNKFIIMSVLFYLSFILSIFWTNASMHEISKMLSHLIFYLFAPLVFITVKRANYQSFFLGFLFAAVVTAILSIATQIFHHQILYGVHDYKGTIFHGHILQNAFLAIAAIMFLVKFFNTTQSFNLRITWITAYLLCAYDIIFVVDGRTGLIMFILMSLFGILFYVNKKDWRVLFMIIIVAAPLVYFSPIVQQGIRNYQHDMQQQKLGNSRTSMGQRVVFHQVTVQLIKARPILGYGVGSFAKNYANYANLHHIDILTVNPHRNILWIWVETGIAGVILFILMVLSAIYEIARLEKSYRVIGLSIILGYVVASLENSFFIDNVTGVTFVTLIISLLTTNKVNLDNLSQYCISNMKKHISI